MNRFLGFYACGVSMAKAVSEFHVSVFGAFSLSACSPFTPLSIVHY